MMVGLRAKISRSCYFPFTAALFVLGFTTARMPAQQLDESAVIRQIDASVQSRLDAVMGYSVTESYAVFRGGDEVHPVAEMSVKTDYRKEAGKTYTILSESGSALVRKAVLGTILDNEKTINKPGVREGSWITSANYEMKLKSGTTQSLDGRDCIILSITPKRKTPYLINGTLWVDVKDYSIVQIHGISSKSPSIFTGPTDMMRQYASVNGFAMATHARAVSNSFLLGKTVVTIDYRGYQMQLSGSR
jgi:hypothetical protein